MTEVPTPPDSPQTPVPAAPAPVAVQPATAMQQLEPAPGAVASMVCGIIGVCFACAGLVLGIIALIKQKKALQLIEQNPTRYGGRGYCTAGKILGIIGIIFGAFWAVYFLIIILAIIAGTAAGVR